jgi:DNA-binding CsgD family transcriptional regulator
MAGIVARDHAGARTPTLLERSAERRVLRAAIDSARAGRGRLVLVRGAAGLGKSALLAAAAAIAAERDLKVLVARGSELEVQLAFGLVLQLFERPLASTPPELRDSLLSGAARLSAPLFGEGPSDLPAAGLVHGLHWLTSNLAERQPLLLVLDDAHWSDRPSMVYVHYLAQRLSELPVTIAVALRPGEAGPAADVLERVDRHPEATRLDLRPLSPGGVARLVRRRLRAADDAFCAACADATQGNPFLVRELAAAVAAEGRKPTAEAAGLVDAVAPGMVLDSVLVRLARLPPDARTVAQAVAVLGGEATLGRVAALAGTEPAAAGAAADALAAVDILRRGEPLGFVHPLVRSAIVADTPAAERSRLHAEAARLVRGAPELVALHLLEAPRTGDDWVVERLREAAAQALRRAAPESAARHLARAVEEPPSELDYPAVLAELGRVEALAGIGTAPERLERAAGLMLDPLERARTLGALGRVHYAGGRHLAAAAAFDRAIACVGEGDPALRAELEAGWITVARLETALRPRAVERMAPMLADPATGTTHAERVLLANVANQLVFAGEPCARAVELARRALADGRLLAEESSDGMTWIAAAGALGWSDAFAEYTAVAEAAIDDARRRGSITGFATASYIRSFSAYFTGRLADALGDLDAALDAHRYGWEQFRGAAIGQCVWALVDRAELDAAERVLALEPPERLHGSPMLAFLLDGRARVLAARGDAAAALENFLAAGRALQAALMPNPALLPWRTGAAIAAARLGHADEARALADEDVALARRFGAARPIGIALRGRGLATGSVDDLEQAVRVLQDSPAQLELARATIDLGAALRRDGRRAIAREHLRLGFDMARRFEAHALERAAAEELAAAGGRARPRSQSGAASSLTPSERRVAGMAARGMTNREIAQALFVTVKAVQWHLRNTYRKLDLSSRDELAAALAEPKD